MSFSILSLTSAEAASFLTKNPVWISLDYGKNPSWQLKSPKLIPKYYIYKTGRQQHNTKHQQYNVEKKREECAWRYPSLLTLQYVYALLFLLRYSSRFSCCFAACFEANHLLPFQINNEHLFKKRKKFKSPRPIIK